MKFGLPISLALHGAVLFGGFIAFGGEVEPILAPPVITAELVSIDDVADIRAAIKAPEPRPAPEPELPSVDTASDEAAEIEDEPVVEAEEPQPTPPAPEPQPEPEPDPDPTEVAELTEPTDTPPPSEPDTPQEPDFNLDNLSDLVNRSRASQEEANRTQTQVAEMSNIDQDLEAREGVGLQMRMTMTELDELRRRMLACWRMPADAPDPDALVVHVGLDLTRDGIPSKVSLIAPSTHSTTDPFMKIAQDRALRAVEKCAPYDFLPQEKYAAWRTIEMTFSTQSSIQGYIEP